MTCRRALPLLLLAAVVLAMPLLALAQQPPLFETTKITDNVYLFRYGGHQSMFVVTPDGVIATDSIAQRRPVAAMTYIAEIRKITQAPIKYVVYSHHHYDHIEGGKPFKDAGATFIAHMNAKTRLEALKNPEKWSSPTSAPETSTPSSSVARGSSCTMWAGTTPTTRW